MLLRHPLLAVLALLAAPSGVLSRGGGHGGSSGGSDSDSGSSSGGSSGGSSGDDSDSGGSDTTSTSSDGLDLSCTDSHRLNFDDLQPSHYDQYNRNPRAGHASAYSEFDGIFFKGFASFKYTIDVLPVIREEDDSYTLYDPDCPVGQQTSRMLGVAWVAGKPPRPAGPKNPIAIGFKAWESNIRLSDIDYSYSVCDDVDLMHFATTVDKFNPDDKEEDDDDDTPLEAMDAVELNITQTPENPNKIQFDGVYDLKNWENSKRDYDNERFDDPGLSDQMLYLPTGTCHESSEGLGQALMRWAGTRVNGSLTNDTLELNLSGVAVAAFPRQYSYNSSYANVTFDISFTGYLDFANSTQVILTGAASQNESLITFERASSATATNPGLSLYLVVFSLAVSFSVFI
ncbi:unnamed protein product [Penicillium salamii]|uniref:Uncharacterized protein n=1 Tax=Penicillium salamii TaxID=1612424 RepID=A0A9W4J2Q1_9EURO|nr:unnamed protein product [Penicillium salamii]CAG8189705.1 unnamed protein product [Penicillium salamii]CAG8261186.1 unnamed protein product [Penicillium salamii]CAG8314499.1 unnamed protein product [Penicillium salamii]CAG8370412.1 unnamed protein product [Penicillium salamii]